MRAGLPFGFLLVGLLVALLSGLGGCSTVEGVGKDIQRGGEAIERAADRNRSD
jgi:predicted small secreted protein